MRFKQRQRLLFPLCGIVCLFFASFLLHSFAGRFSSKNLNSAEMPVLEDSINIEQKEKQIASEAGEAYAEDSKKNKNSAVGFTDVEAKENVSERKSEPSKKREEHDGNKVKLNTAGQSDFEALPGIGPKIAALIIDYRTRHGKFSKIEDLLKVRGIGPKKYKKIKEYVSLEK